MDRVLELAVDNRRCSLDAEAQPFWRDLEIHVPPWCDAKRHIYHDETSVLCPRVTSAGLEPRRPSILTREEPNVPNVPFVIVHGPSSVTTRREDCGVPSRPLYAFDRLLHFLDRLGHFFSASMAQATTIASHAATREVKLYCSWFCPYAQRAFIACEEKQLNYQYIEVCMHACALAPARTHVRLYAVCIHARARA